MMLRDKGRRKDACLRFQDYLAYSAPGAAERPDVFAEMKRLRCQR